MYCTVESVAAPEDRFRSLHEKLEELELSLAKEREVSFCCFPYEATTDTPDNILPIPYLT